MVAEISRAGRAFFAVKKLHQPTTTSTLNGQTKRESKKTTGKEPNKNTSRNLKGGVRFQSSSFCLRNWTLQLVLERKKEKNKTPLDTLARLRFEFYDTVDILQFCRTPVYVPNQLGHGLSSREGPGHHTRHRATVQASRRNRMLREVPGTLLRGSPCRFTAGSSRAVSAVSPADNLFSRADFVCAGSPLPVL